MRISDWSSDVCSSDLFSVPHDRVSDCRHLHAKLVRASGIGLQFDPAGAVSGALYNAVARACGKPFLLVHMHFFSSGARLLGKGKLDHAIIDGGHAYNQRPIDLTRRTAGKALCEERDRKSVG